MERIALVASLVLAAGLVTTQGAVAPTGAFDRAVTPVVPSEIVSELPSDRPDRASAPDLPPFPSGYRIRIPRLAIDLPIAEGDTDRDVVSQRTPEGSAFHLPGTGAPGEGTNTYLYAHARAGMFLSLRGVKVGDTVIIDVPDGRSLHYAISEVHPGVPPSDTSMVRPTTSELLTLQTSTGPFPDDPRFVAIAVPVT